MSSVGLKRRTRVSEIFFSYNSGAGSWILDRSIIMSSSNSNIGVRGHSHGMIAQLFGFKNSAVLLMDYDENQTIRLLAMGEFVVYLLLQIHRPIVVAACYVDGFHWPLTKDSIVFRVTKRTFAIALPGLLYGLQFPHFCGEQLLDDLEKIFSKFGHYCRVLDNKGLDYSLNDDEPLLWYKLRPRIESMANEVLSRFGQLPGRSRFCVTSYINTSYSRAIRMSAATKLVVDNLSKSETITESHMIVAGANPALIPDGIINQSSTFASVSVFVSLVDFLEYVEVTSCGLGYLIQSCEPPLRNDIGLGMGFKHWKLNQHGFVFYTNLLGPLAEQEQQIVAEKSEKWKAKEKEVAESSSAAAAAAGTSDSSVGPDDKGKGVMP